MSARIPVHQPATSAELAVGRLTAVTALWLRDAVNDPELHAIFYEHLVRPRREALGNVLKRAMARGELRGDIDLELMIDLFAGPAVYRVKQQSIEVLRIYHTAQDRP